MATILVTGGTGFIGSKLATKLYSLGHQVIITGTESEQTCSFTHFIGNDLQSLYDFKQIDYCFHQAAHNDTTDTNEKYMYESNCLWSKKLFTILKKLNCKKIVYASSASVYGDLPSPHDENMETKPLNVYASSKNILEIIADDFGKKNDICMIGLRYFNVYGCNESHKKKRASMIYQLCSQALEHGLCTLFKWGLQTRDWVSVHDVVNCNLLCLNYSENDIFNVGSGVSVSMNDIVKTIKIYINKNVNINYIDNPHLDKYQNNTLANIQKAQIKLKYHPQVNIEDGIKEILDFKLAKI